MSQRKAYISDTVLPYLVLRHRGALLSLAGAPAEVHPGGQNLDRQVCHWQQHPGPEALPVQQKAVPVTMPRRWADWHVEVVDTPTSSALRYPVLGDSLLLHAVSPQAAHTVAGHPAVSHHHIGPPGTGHCQASSWGASNGILVFMSKEGIAWPEISCSIM